MVHRRGFTLIEMAVVIAVSAVLMGIGTGILGLLLRSERLARDDLGYGRSVSRLAEQFRDDVHAAAEGPHSRPGQTGWQWQLPPDRTVVYQLKPGTISRTEWVGKVLRRQESYNVPAEGAARIEISPDARPATARLLLDQPGGSQLRIEAAVGRDYRFTKGSKRSEP
jgi:prepilin-type N-terminal cleavage/methylation domain-containing protein